MKERTIFCPQCGSEVPQGAFCLSCGTELPQLKSRPATSRPGSQKRGRRRRKYDRRRQDSKVNSQETATSKQGLIFGQVIGVLSALGILIGVFLPWVEISAVGIDLITIDGTQFRAGSVALILGGTAAVTMIIPDRASHIIAGACGGVALLMMGLFLSEPLLFESNLSEFEEAIARGALDGAEGAYMTLGGAVGVVGGALISILSTEEHRRN